MVAVAFCPELAGGDLLLTRVDKPALLRRVCELFYWREGNREVDFVLRTGRLVVAPEVKSGRAPVALPGLAAFSEAFRPRRTLLVGGNGIPVGEFLSRPVAAWLQP